MERTSDDPALWRCTWLCNQISGITALAFSPAVHAYIRLQRNRLRPYAHPLDGKERTAVQMYFPPKVLEHTLVVIADPLPIPDPPLASIARRLGFHFPRPSTVEAITFDNVIASRKPLSPSVLFHELVHTVQYQSLGLGGFARRYTQGFLETGDYYRIPLERCAFHLQFRYQTEREPFDAEAEILRNLGQ
jgi:hypothetical protein